MAGMERGAPGSAEGRAASGGRARRPAVVALGGGHGLAASLRALRDLTPETVSVTAIVTVADNGGSSGRLRVELDALPPGDLRMALVALSGGDEDARTWSTVMQHRFGGTGPMKGHPVGNLVLTGLAEVLGDPVAALREMGRLLGCAGRVLPASCVPLDIVAEVSGLVPADPGRLTLVRGQVAVATTRGHVQSVRTSPLDPPACPEAVQAVLDADWVVLGPGSWFSSVLPHLAVPQLAKALCETSARRIVVLNLAPQRGETEGYGPDDHLAVLAAHAPQLRLDVVVADPSSVPDVHRLEQAAGDLGARLVVADVRVAAAPQHDPVKLAQVYRGLVTAAAAQPDGG